ncbi:MAG: class II glutamine amidotransferase [Mariprofundaceae bacterium]
MCQLLGMNCNVPTDILFSFEGLRARGGVTDEHSDGWGIGFFEGPGCRLFIDTKPSAQSPVAVLVQQYPIHSLNVISHIRKATQGKISLQNTHPFLREMWGRYWLFAHNGNLEHVATYQGCYRPVGDTDSERAFCLMLNTLHAQFDKQPPLPELYAALSDINTRLANQGTLNYLLSNGEYMFAHCVTQLSYIIRRAPFGPAHLIDQDVTVDFHELTTMRDVVAIIATLPLTDNETWTDIKPRELLAFQHGEVVV